MKTKPILLILLFFLIFVICYYFVDRQLTLWLYTHKLYQYRLFYYLTYIPNMLAYGSIILFFPFFMISNFQKIKDWQKAQFACSVNIYMAVVISHTLKFILGRSDPKQFIATIYSHKIIPYGFHFFQAGYGDMPSGHTTAIFAAATLIWQIYPGLRWLCGILCLAVVLGLLAMNHHFLGGCIAGALVGIFIGVYSKKFYFPSKQIEPAAL